jgi:hypothetical protein
MAEEIPTTTKAPIAFGDSIGIGAFVFAMIAFAFLPTWWLRLPLLIAAIAGLVFLVYRSLLTHAWNPLTKLLVASASSIVLLIIGISQIVDQLKAENRWQPFVVALSSFRHGLARVVASPWMIRGTCVFVGMVAILFYQWIKRTLSSLKEKRAILTGQDKGFLDFKLQAETAMADLSSAIEPISAITDQVGNAMARQAQEITRAVAMSTGSQLRTTRVGALRLDKYSRRLDSKCLRLEQVGSSLQEGLLGWYIWAHKQEVSRIALSQATPSLRTLCRSITSGIQGTDNYIATFEAMKGVSRDMNGALERHIQVLRRIRNANSNILIACVGALNIADSTLSSEQPRRIPTSEHEVTT